MVQTTQQLKREFLIEQNLLHKGGTGIPGYLTEQEYLDYLRKNKIVKSTVTAALIATTIGVSALTYQVATVSIEDNIKTEQIKTYANVVAPQDALFGKVFKPVTAKVFASELTSVTYASKKGDKLIAPISGTVISKKDGTLTAQTKINDVTYLVALSNTSTAKSVGDKLTAGTAIGTATGKVTMTLKDKVGNAVKFPGELALSITSSQINDAKVKTVSNRVASYISTNLDGDRQSFAEMAKPMLVKAYKDYGILPSTVLAQGFLESEAGKSELAVNANNFFGHKAGGAWTGATYDKLTKEEYTVGNVVDVVQTFRKYATPQDGIKGHLEFLQKDNYSSAIGVKDAEKQIAAIKAGGYATDSGYVAKLMRVVEEENLTALNDAVLKEVSTKDAIATVVSDAKVQKLSTAYDKHVAVFDAELKETKTEHIKLGDGSEKILVAQATVENKNNVKAEDKKPLPAKEKTVEVKREKGGKYMDDPTVDGVKVSVTIDGTKTLLENINLATLTKQQATTIITELNKSKEYKVVRNDMLETLLKTVENEKIAKYLTGNYEGKKLDTLMDLAPALLGETKMTESQKGQLSALDGGKLRIKVVDDYYEVATDLRSKDAVNLGMVEKIKDIPTDYSDIKVPFYNIDFEGRLIALDAGHSIVRGKDNGAAHTYSGESEGTVNQEMVQAIKSKLEASNARVLLINDEGNKFLEPGARAAYANKMGADLFISFHYNADEKSSVGGTSTHYQNGKAEGQKLANAVHKYHTQAMYNLKNRGAVADNLAVTRETTMPAILMETGYISNPYEAALSTQEVVHQSVANGVIAGFADYLGLEKKKPRPEINKDSEEVVYTDAKQELVADVENKEKDESKDTPKNEPTDESTDESTDVPTDESTDESTDVPTDESTDVPTDVPTDESTDIPTDESTDESTDVPTDESTDESTDVPTDESTDVPTDDSTDVPTDTEKEKNDLVEEMNTMYED